MVQPGPFWQIVLAKTARAASCFWRLDRLYSPNLYPPDLANADITGGPDGHDWGYVGATGIGGRSIRALRGKALRGSSTVNAAVAIRARAADFAKWSALGIQGRSFDDVLASYIAVEIRRMATIGIAGAPVRCPSARGGGTSSRPHSTLSLMPPSIKGSRALPTSTVPSKPASVRTRSMSFQAVASTLLSPSSMMAFAPARILR